jgi:hypothetical protein
MLEEIRCAAALLLVVCVQAASCAPRVCGGVQGCDGNARISLCSPGEPLREDCGARKCAVATPPSGEAISLCTLDGRPDERCGPDGTGTFCDGNRSIECQYGFPMFVFDCAPDGLICASDGKESVCVASLDPDPHCPSSRRFCENDVLATCFGPFLQPFADCRKSQSFCKDDGTTAACVLDRDPDPRCSGVSHFCDGPRGFRCFDGFRSSLAGDCSAQNMTCVADNDTFGCR